MKRVVLPAIAMFAVALSFSGCNAEVEVGMDRLVNTGASSGSGGATGGGATGGGAGGSGGATECMPASCGKSTTWRCGNCMDDDADGLIDSADPDCVGACDDTEDSFDSGIPGQNSGNCSQDCYFDRDSGNGNDGCSWTHSCDELSVDPIFAPSGMTQCEYEPGTICDELRTSQNAMCLDTCLPLTPNGCDCFGCCELPAGGGTFIWLGSTMAGAGSCDRDSLDDELRCKRCTPVESCFNACEHCELCAGKTELPADCTGGAETQCAPFLQPCGGNTGLTCPVDSYCITGCCVAIPT